MYSTRRHTFEPKKEDQKEPIVCDGSEDKRSVTAAHFTRLVDELSFYAHAAGLEDLLVPHFLIWCNLIGAESQAVG